MSSAESKKSKLDGKYFSIVANTHKNELSIVERMNNHLSITKEDLHAILSEKFSEK